MTATSAIIRASSSVGGRLAARLAATYRPDIAVREMSANGGRGRAGDEICNAGAAYVADAAGGARSRCAGARARPAGGAVFQ